MKTLNKQTVGRPRTKGRDWTIYIMEQRNGGHRQKRSACERKEKNIVNFVTRRPIHLEKSMLHMDDNRVPL
jgi:hypothetical protein